MMASLFTRSSSTRHSHYFKRGGSRIVITTKPGAAIPSDIGGLGILTASSYFLFQQDDNDGDDKVVMKTNLLAQKKRNENDQEWGYNTFLQKQMMILPSIQCNSNTTSSHLTSTLTKSQTTQQLYELSSMQRILHKLKLKLNLPTPRILSSHDPIFAYPQLKRGLKQRYKDEEALRGLQSEAIAARQSGNADEIQKVFGRISSIAFGVGITPQERENFLMRYGCTGWTTENLNYLIELGKNRGYVEIGAGNGQWARAIQDHHKKHVDEDNNNEEQQQQQSNNKSHTLMDFIIPYDDMSDLPLSPKIYHNYTQPAHDFFHKNVQQESHISAAKQMTSRGRVLLLVYPPPGPMALETVQEFVNIYPEGNDTVVYVGEGIGGANANDEFFGYLLNKKTYDGDDNGGPSYKWCVVKTMDVLPSLGGKGYEKMFVLQRVKI